MVHICANHDDDMVTNLFHPFEDDPTQHFQDDFRPSLVSYDAYLFCEDFQPSHSNFDRHQVMASLGHSEVHTTKLSTFMLRLLVGIYR
jgi:hypothetical protein